MKTLLIALNICAFAAQKILDYGNVLTIRDSATNASLENIDLLTMRVWQDKDVFETSDIKITSNQTADGKNGSMY